MAVFDIYGKAIANDGSCNIVLHIYPFHKMFIFYFCSPLFPFSPFLIIGHKNNC